MRNIKLLSLEGTQYPRILIRGAGEVASGVAHRFYRCGFPVCLTELSQPTAISRSASFCDAIYEGKKTIECVTAESVSQKGDIWSVIGSERIPIIVDADNKIKELYRPHVLVDARPIQKNDDTRCTDALLVIGIGTKFRIGSDVHVVVDTTEGNDFGRLIFCESVRHKAFSRDVHRGRRPSELVRAPKAGEIKSLREIGDYINRDEIVACISGEAIRAPVTGFLRGIARNCTWAEEGQVIMEIICSKQSECFGISKDIRALAGSVLEAVLFLLPNQIRRKVG